MDRITAILLADLQHVTAELGSDGGKLSPSIYDTAQVLRFSPPEDPKPVIDWLLSEQASDGGWGHPEVPHTRDAPTLAALLALRAAGTGHRVERAIKAAEAFIRNQGVYWGDPLPEDIPVGVELLVPALIQQAGAYGITIAREPYAALMRLGERRRQVIARMGFPAGSTPSHSWEGLGVPATVDVLDGSGGVGHSPTATAAWLHAMKDTASFQKEKAAARAYLEQASAVTESGIPGLVPTVWPIANFERVWGLFALHMSGLLTHPMLRPTVERQIDQIEANLGPNGLGMGGSNWFTGDGDTTGTALALLGAAGRRSDIKIIQRFASSQPGAFYTFIGEMQHSISATAHAAHGLAMLGGDVGDSIELLLSQRTRDLRWTGDKWQASWLYLTSHIIALLCDAGRANDALETLPGLLAHQRPDSSWGSIQPSMEDTTYAVQILTLLDRAGVLPAEGRAALASATRWVAQNYRPFVFESERCWMGKELYTPFRVVRVLVLSALLSSTAWATLERAA
jgi:halimadienyl-diphosphate synthase